MKVMLNKPIVSSMRDGAKAYSRTHADTGDVLQVIFRNKTHYICESLRYPHEQIVVFNSQVDATIDEPDVQSIMEDEEYYASLATANDANNIPVTDDLFYTELLCGDGDDNEL